MDSQTVRVWDAETGDALVEYRGGTSSYVFGVTMDSCVVFVENAQSA